MLKVQQNHKVGIYVRLSKDDERAGESVLFSTLNDASFFTLNGAIMV